MVDLVFIVQVNELMNIQEFGEWLSEEIFSMLTNNGEINDFKVKVFFKGVDGE